MKLQFIGTAASEGVPATFCDCPVCREAREKKGRYVRKRSSILVNDRILIDFNADSHLAGIYGGLDFLKVEHILFTHSHTDHCSLEALRAIEPPCAVNDRVAPLHLYGSEAIHDLYKDSCLLGIERDGYVDFTLAIPLTPIAIDGAIILPIDAKHDDSEVCLNYVISDGEASVFYGTDSALPTETLFEQFKGLKFDGVILDCTSLESAGVFENHMGIEDNLAFRQRMLEWGVCREDTPFYMTHMAHQFNPNVENVERLGHKYGLTPAYDDLVIEVTRRT